MTVDKKVFVDTNILVYAYNRDAGQKHERAQKRIETLWDGGVLPSISIQVLQELYVTLRRKGVSQLEIRGVIKDLQAWEVIENTRELLGEGMDLQERYRLSFWDAMILAAAVRSGARELWSEDFSTGQRYEDIRAVNPLEENC